MRKAVRAIIIKDDQLLVMHRNKFGREYYSLIGGGIDFGESAEQALLREVHEETGVIFQNPRLVFIEESGEPYGTQFVYLCDYVQGEPVLDVSSAEASITAMGQNLYTPMWLPLAKLPEVVFVADILKGAMLEALEKGFPDTPKTLHDIA